MNRIGEAASVQPLPDPSSYDLDPINPKDIRAGEPVARARHAVGGPEGLTAGYWHCTAGRFVWYYGMDEVVHLLEGEVLLTSTSGETTRLTAGQMFIFRQGTEWEWDIADEVHKVFFLRPQRALRKRVQTRLQARRIRARRG